MRDAPSAYTVFSAKGATGASNTIPVSDFNVICIALHGDATADMTVKVCGSIADTAPTWTSAQSLTNSWDYVSCVDIEDNAVIAGDTGIVFSGADDRMLEVNVNALKHVALRITTWTAGSLTAYIVPFSYDK